MDTKLLTDAIYAGAVIAGSELVKEATKDAWRGLKSGVTKVFGLLGERVIGRIEASPGDASARSEVADLARLLPPEETADLQRQIARLLDALRDDDAAKTVVESIAHIRLEVEAGGNVTLERLDGVSGIEVKAKAGGDFALRDVNMARGADAGN
jgi:hypothetical protein